MTVLDLPDQKYFPGIAISVDPGKSYGSGGSRKIIWIRRIQENHFYPPDPGKSFGSAGSRKIMRIRWIQENHADLTVRGKSYASGRSKRGMRIRRFQENHMDPADPGESRRSSNSKKIIWIWQKLTGFHTAKNSKLKFIFF